MTRNYKFHNPKSLYFVSFSVVYWIDVFTRAEYHEIVLEALRFAIKHKSMRLFAWCIMTNHVHLIFDVSEPEKPELVLGDIKRYTSRKLTEAIAGNPRESRKEWMLALFSKAAEETSNTTKFQFWRHDNHPIELWSIPVIKQKINYIHYNPVKGGIVSKPNEYMLSSALDYSGGQGLLKEIELIH